MSVFREANAEPIPGYRLIEPLGSGGFGEVWRCEAPGGIFKAIKFVYGNLHALDVEAIRAEQELKALERVKNIRHPFILTIERNELLQYLRDAAEALDLMHRQHSLQHLDIKPSNLFLVSNRVKVADFGL